MLTIIFKSNNTPKNHPHKPPNKHYYYENKYFFMIFVVINQTNKHKAKIYNQCTYTQVVIKKTRNYIKKILSLNYKKFFCFDECKNNKFIIS